MIRKFRVENFMCLKDVTIDLNPFNIFIGPNSSGKSALFKALSSFTKLMRFPVRGDFKGDFNVEPGVTLDDVVWCGDTALPIVFYAWFTENTDGEPDYTIELRRSYAGWSITREKFYLDGRWIDTSIQPFTFNLEKGQKTWTGPYTAPLAYLTYPHCKDPVAAPYLQPLQELRRKIGEARRYRPSASEIASFTKLYSSKKTARPPEVDETGKNFSLALQDVWKSDRGTFDRIQEGVKRLHSHVKGIDFVADWRGTGIVYKTDRVTLSTPASLESDGVLLSTFLLWRVLTARQNLKLCLEEPENGVHIAALKERYQLLKGFVGSIDNLQILIATHSRDLLNAIGLRNDILDEVRVAEYSTELGTKIHSLHHYREINQLLEECRDKMGDLWWSNRLT
jgi:predicted ATPase